VTQFKALVVAISLGVSMAGSGAAQQMGPTSETRILIETCAGCFAYLEFAPNSDAESRAMHDQVTEASVAPPEESDLNGSSEQVAGLLPTKQ
jgi:hypothetical protein